MTETEVIVAKTPKGKHIIRNYKLDIHEVNAYILQATENNQYPTYRDLADHFQVTEDTIGYLVRKHDINNIFQYRFEKRNQEITEFAKQNPGCNCREIGQNFNLSNAQIALILRKAGLKRSFDKVSKQYFWGEI